MSERMFEEFPDLTRTDWLKQAEKDLKGVSLDKLNWQNESGIPLKAIYDEQFELAAGEDRDRSSVMFVPFNTMMIGGV